MFGCLAADEILSVKVLKHLILMEGEVRRYRGDRAGGERERLDQ